MKTWFKTFLFIQTVLVFAITSCTRKLSPVSNPAPHREFAPLEKQLVQSCNTFGFRLFQEVNRSEQNKNVFISPLSVSMALGMTLNGAAGKTEADMRQALAFGGWSEEDINASYKNILDILPNLDPKTQLEIANSIWYRIGFSVLPEFIDVNRQYFYAAVRGLDFASSEAPTIINGWIDDKTRGKITHMIDQIDPLTVMFLIDAVYFKGTWFYEFNPDLTHDDIFTKFDGGQIPCKMMEQKATLAYFETELFQAVDLPYGNGGYSMAIFLPKYGRSVESLVSEITPENWSSWKNRFADQEVALQLPKFKLEYEIELTNVLTALGMGAAFIPNVADFSRINAEIQLYISMVKHKACVDVDEKGTEAAAVTIVEISLTAIEPQGIAMRVDRPFVFVIREKSSDALLFMGKIEAP
jgi:serine protease inhibitor